MGDIGLILLQEFCKGSQFYIPILCLLFAGSVWWYAIQHVKSPTYLSRTIKYIGVGIFCLIMSRILWIAWEKHDIRWLNRGLSFIGMILIILPLIYAFYKFSCVHIKLKRAIRYSSHTSYDWNYVTSWRELNRIKPSELSAAQLKSYHKYRTYLCIMLGSMKSVEYDLDKINSDSDGKNETILTNQNRAYYHFLQSCRYNAMGHMAEASEHIKKACDFCDAESDPLIRAQLYVNMGVNYVVQGMFIDADEYFEKAIQFCTDQSVIQKDVWVILYANHILNKTRINPNIGKAELEIILEGLVKHLDLELPIDYIEYSNVHMELLRQIGASRDDISENIYYCYDFIEHSRLPKENKCMFHCSIARMIWSAMLDPTYILNTLSREREEILQLPMPARYRCFKEIDILFSDLNGELVKEHMRLREYAHWYILNQAAIDLEEYRKTLPEQAVYERCYCLCELAGMMKKRPEQYSANRANEYLENAIALYRDNDLDIEICMMKLAQIDEAGAELNMNEDYEVRNGDRVTELLKEVETFLPEIRKHPLLTEVYLRISYYSWWIHDYDKCKKYYEAYHDLKDVFSINHYAPWIHRYYLGVCFVVRVLYFMEAIEKIRVSADLKYQNPYVQEWFTKFFERDGGLESYLLGRFMGLSHMYLKSRVWPIYENRTGIAEIVGTTAHFWLFFPSMDMEIDPTYIWFTEDEFNKKLLFASGRHPMETGNSNFLKQFVLPDEPLYHSVLMIPMDDSRVPESRRQDFEVVYNLILQNIPSQCPEIQEISNLYSKVIAPVKAEG